MDGKFVWDVQKAQTNLVKQGIRFEETSTVFADPMRIVLLDEEHSVDEQHFITIGYSQSNRLLLVAHVERAGKTRIISAREVRRNERGFYEQGHNDYDLRDEYDLSQLPVMPEGRYAPERWLGTNLMALAPDVAEAFPNDAAVNEALRLVLQIAKMAQPRELVTEP